MLPELLYSIRKLATSERCWATKPTNWYAACEYVFEIEREGWTTVEKLKQHQRTYIHVYMFWCGLSSLETWKYIWPKSLGKMLLQDYRFALHSEHFGNGLCSQGSREDPNPMTTHFTSSFCSHFLFCIYLSACLDAIAQHTSSISGFSFRWSVPSWFSYLERGA